MKILFLPVLILTCLIAKATCLQSVRGIHPESSYFPIIAAQNNELKLWIYFLGASLYDSNKKFTCLDGSAVIPFDQVNDDYCDCKFYNSPGFSIVNIQYLILIERSRWQWWARNFGLFEWLVCMRKSRLCGSTYSIEPCKRRHLRFLSFLYFEFNMLSEFDLKLTQSNRLLWWFGWVQRQSEMWKQMWRIGCQDERRRRETSSSPRTRTRQA